MKTWIACLIVSAFASMGVAAEAERMIVKDGQPAAQIVIAPEHRPRMATLAALELQRGLQKISGVRLPIVTAAEPGVAVNLYVGASPATRALGVSDAGLKHGAFRIVSSNNWLALVGNDWDFVPPFEPWPMRRNDEAPAAAWQKRTAALTTGAWQFPFEGQGKRLWSPKDFGSVMDAYYGTGAAALWTTGGNTLKGFWLADEAGSVNAVSEFLFRLGVRNFMPGELGEIIPAMSSIALPDINRTVEPDFAVRNWMWYNYGAFPLEEVLWALRLGINSGYQKMGPSTGPHGLVVVHSAPEMKKAHPEYYALIGGKRGTDVGKGGGTPCFMSEGFIRETINYCRFMLGELNLPAIDIWPGDGLQMCQCEKCRGKTPSELVWGFTDRVARELYKTYPDRLVTGGAYTSYDQAPDTIERFSPNVAVAIYNYGRASFLDEDVWHHYVTNLEKWRVRLAPGQIRRGENNLFNGSPSPGRRQKIAYPIIFPRGMAKDLKHLKGISYGELAECPQLPGRWKAPGVDHLALYVQARFLMDADQDIDTLLDEYYRLFYGPAAAPMREAFTYAEDHIATKDRSKSGGRANITNVPLESKLRIRDLLDKAQAAAGDSVYGRRIAKIIAELKTRDEVIAEDQAQKAVLLERAAKARLAVGVNSTNLSAATVHDLVDARTGAVPRFPTSFKVGWDANTLVLDILCKEPDMTHLALSTPVYEGDYVAIAIETPLHSFYLLHIAPDGRIAEGNPAAGEWASLAEVTPERGADFWRLKVRLPAVTAAEAEADPNHRIAGERPTAETPWFFLVGRHRVRGGDTELQSFSPLRKGGGWRSLADYGKLEIR